MRQLLVAVLAAAFVLGSAELRADDKTPPIPVPQEKAWDVPGKTPEQRRHWWLHHTGDFGQRGRGVAMPNKGQPMPPNKDTKEKKIREMEKIAPPGQ